MLFKTIFSFFNIAAKMFTLFENIDIYFMIEKKGFFQIFKTLKIPIRNNLDDAKLSNITVWGQNSTGCDNKKGEGVI